LHYRNKKKKKKKRNKSLGQKNFLGLVNSKRRRRKL
jgi:hypothetical protein